LGEHEKNGGGRPKKKLLDPKIAKGSLKGEKRLKKTGGSHENKNQIQPGAYHQVMCPLTKPNENITEGKNESLG